jgi:hypothetical protein
MDTVDLSATVNDQISLYEHLLSQAELKQARFDKTPDLWIDSNITPHIEGIRSALNQLKQAR